ncbi:DedA family protein [Labedella populi]|uniref:DedA family protein n=1 Tax=Labedella populi TaxID=2498850 RepID=A0A3S3ZM64_9MICO|nr:VTT domain-containing protein [Labedella populi]RWZ58466.1 DedA family protein [Labedella populi]
MWDVFTALSALSVAIEDAVTESVGLPYVLVIVAALCMVDAVFPVVPSESVLIAVATVSTSAAVATSPAAPVISADASVTAPAIGPPLWALVLVAALAAWIGDHLVFHLGRRIGPRRRAWLRRPRVVRGMAWATRALARRGGLYIVTGRFIPGGRVAVNFVAGSTRYPPGRFAITAGVAAIVWASYSVGIGVFFGAVFDGQPLLAMFAGIVVALVAGIVLDAVFGRRERRRDGTTTDELRG